MSKCISRLHMLESDCSMGTSLDSSILLLLLSIMLRVQNLQAWAIISSNPLIESHPTYSNIFTNMRTNLPLCSGFSRQDSWAYICIILHCRIEIGFNSTCYYHLERAIHQNHGIKLWRWNTWPIVRLFWLKYGWYPAHLWSIPVDLSAMEARTIMDIL